MPSKITILSGGTATNQLVPLFKRLSPNNNISYILPISDNGGSTSEIIRVIGGPAIGDIRSRLTRLIPSHQESLRKLLSFRLSSDAKVAKQQWNEIVEGTHELWIGINSSTKEIFRAFFVHLHVELLKRSRHQISNKNKQFRYEMANVGNLFLTGARLFIGSLDSAIELFCKLTDIDPSIEVLPCINTNFTYHISAILENGLIITGQSQISHPSDNHEKYPPPIHKTRPPTPSEVTHKNSDEEEAGNVPQYTHPELKKSQLHFSKSDNIEPLLSPIKRIFYVSPYGEEICPTAHGKVASTIANTDALIYSIGSLMTSIVPIIILKGIGKAILQNECKRKILLLNGCLDRETFGMTASDFIRVIVSSAEYSINSHANGLAAKYEWNRFITHLVYMEDSSIDVDVDYLTSKGVTCVKVAKVEGTNYFDLKSLENVLDEII
ncbi:hypothetical protein FOB64_001787 [Candida albicans]|uniref:Uncharacterized protein n=1 Tax=Candida albicans TaxID=5476 RepID=A0A8H6BXR9_CANAX|nr:hypothetical protein FOB64_003416 [Candida albicans]KAF6070690.1 hypothetical protein FOB64_001787 [Candida albicans]